MIIRYGLEYNHRNYMQYIKDRILILQIIYGFNIDYSILMTLKKLILHVQLYISYDDYIVIS